MTSVQEEEREVSTSPSRLHRTLSCELIWLQKQLKNTRSMSREDQHPEHCKICTYFFKSYTNVKDRGKKWIHCLLLMLTADRETWILLSLISILYTKKYVFCIGNTKPITMNRQLMRTSRSEDNEFPSHHFYISQLPLKPYTWSRNKGEETFIEN